MSNIKERLLGAITVMSDEEANRLWAIIKSNHLDDKWAAIEEAEPDEIDLQMIREAEEDPDCHEFISEEEAQRLFDE